MVFPIADDNSDRTLVPVVNYVLLAVNLLVFVAFQKGGTDERFTYTYSTVPQEIITGKDVVGSVPIRDPRTGSDAGTIEHQPLPSFLPVYVTLLTSMFMHGGWAHLLGNMWFLWIFGDNVEDALGHGRYLLFYLTTGLLASLAHVLATYGFGGNLLIPSLGASGAISGVMGGYLLLHPHRRVTVILFRILTEVPAYVAVGIWFLFQLISGLGVFGGPQTGGGVAYAAHIGGFLAGAGLIQLSMLGRDTNRWRQTRHQWPRGW